MNSDRKALVGRKVSGHSVLEFPELKIRSIISKRRRSTIERKAFVKNWKCFFKNTGANIRPKCWIEILSSLTGLCCVPTLLPSAEALGYFRGWRLMEGKLTLRREKRGGFRERRFDGLGNIRDRTSNIQRRTSNVARRRSVSSSAITPKVNRRRGLSCQFAVM